MLTNSSSLTPRLSWFIKAIISPIKASDDFEGRCLRSMIHLWISESLSNRLNFLIKWCLKMKKGFHDEKSKTIPKRYRSKGDRILSLELPSSSLFWLSLKFRAVCFVLNCSRISWAWTLAYCGVVMVLSVSGLLLLFGCCYWIISRVWWP